MKISFWITHALCPYIVATLILWLFWQEIIPVEISRVNQVDAGRLDVEMSAMLKEQLVKVFSLLKVNIMLLIVFVWSRSFDN